MVEVVFGGISPRSLGDLLKGYGVMAVLGERWPDTLFSWDDQHRLVASVPPENLASGNVNRDIEDLIADPSQVIAWASEVGDHFQAVPGSKTKGIAREETPLADPARHDDFSDDLALFARAVALSDPRDRNRDLEPHPLFAKFGQDYGRGNYFAQLAKAAQAAAKARPDLSWSLFAKGTPQVAQPLKSGLAFFPEAMKRYATGTQKWVREKDAPRSTWCFLLAMRGAMLLRGSLRRLRWGRRPYPAFPFVFRGSAVQAGRDTLSTWEIHLPTWTREHPRTLDEFELQVHQFHARFRTGSFAATAAEFRAAVVARAAGVAFDAFHRFVLEPRRPGQRRPMPQGVPRGLTQVGRPDVADLRLMLAPLAESGWIDQFDVHQELRLERARFDEAVHRAVDQPSPEAYVAILEALWHLNQALLLPRRVRRQLEALNRTPIPVPPLPHRPWELALASLMHRLEYRLARAIGSIQGVKGYGGDRGIGPLLEHLLPLRWSFRRGWWEPNLESARPHLWNGVKPELDFGRLFWQRWLDGHDLDALPFRARRAAPLADVAALLRGEVEIGRVHRLVPLFALLDWRDAEGAPVPRPPCSHAALSPPAYVALRLWLELGIHPPEGSRPPRDGAVARLLALGAKSQVERATERALARLRIDGLPWNDEPHPTGKTVARFVPVLSEGEARRMAVAVLTPISKRDTLRLSRRLWVGVDDRIEREE